MEEISLMTTTIDSTQLQNDKIESKSIFRWDWTLTMQMEHEKYLEIVFHSNWAHSFVYSSISRNFDLHDCWRDTVWWFYKENSRTIHSKSFLVAYHCIGSSICSIIGPSVYWLVCKQIIITDSCTIPADCDWYSSLSLLQKL